MRLRSKPPIGLGRGRLAIAHACGIGLRAAAGQDSSMTICKLRTLQPIPVRPFGFQHSTGLMSMTGVPSIASMGPIRTRFLAILRTVT